jgi:2-polyprenyl-3-methyl-5-hydroxy-6-metoxy-1,4-benzoquinol methylase
MSETFERITSDQVAEQDGHRYRYELAAKLMPAGSSVVDIACGIGYGAEIIQNIVAVDYYGFDKIAPDAKYAGRGEFVHDVDLNTFSLPRDYDYGICFETLEHLENPQHLANELMAHTELFMVSVPTIPTKHLNPFHLHDFTVDNILYMFKDCELLSLEEQPSEFSHIFTFRSPNA